MTEPAPAFSYRKDPSVPAFDDSVPLFVFDGVCVLCSGGAAWLMRTKGGKRVNFTPAQGPLGQALYRHFGMDMDETYLLVTEGRPFAASSGYLQLCKTLGGPWHLLRAFHAVPAPLRDWAYRLIARNRYRWFGRTEFCGLLTPDQRSRLI